MLPFCFALFFFADPKKFSRGITILCLIRIIYKCKEFSLIQITNNTSLLFFSDHSDTSFIGLVLTLLLIMKLWFCMSVFVCVFQSQSLFFLYSPFTCCNLYIQYAVKRIVALSNFEKIHCWQ